MEKGHLRRRVRGEGTRHDAKQTGAETPRAHVEGLAEETARRRGRGAGGAQRRGAGGAGERGLPQTRGGAQGERHGGVPGAPGGGEGTRGCRGGARGGRRGGRALRQPAGIFGEDGGVPRTARGEDRGVEADAAAIGGGSGGGGGGGGGGAERGGGPGGGRTRRRSRRRGGREGSTGRRGRGRRRFQGEVLRSGAHGEREDRPPAPDAHRGHPARLSARVAAVDDLPVQQPPQRHLGGRDGPGENRAGVLADRLPVGEQAELRPAPHHRPQRRHRQLEVGDQDVAQEHAGGVLRRRSRGTRQDLLAAGASAQVQRPRHHL